ncbi:hypothetical protein EHO59_12860 [Leptospira semungkisensis]|uniref:Uncharacterized protein n=1 Tax=Leptospira semungkisensis TaxID=2484985 RepID=A0A4R9FSE9_9LEPT|nr:hypothetical protein [Leptospira semungkisensis]TGK00817.1 hypothetical protein EHO59_12860 [Leptospira semungkisensis]
MILPSRNVIKQVDMLGVSEEGKPPLSPPVCKQNLGTIEYWTEVLQNTKGKKLDLLYERHLRDCVLCSQIVHYYLEDNWSRSIKDPDKLLLGKTDNRDYLSNEENSFFFRILKGAIERKDLIQLAFYSLAALPILQLVYYVFQNFISKE